MPKARPADQITTASPGRRPRAAAASRKLAQADPPTPQIDNLLCFALYVTARASEAKYRPVLSRLGLTYPRYIVLLVLRERDGISLGTLGGQLQLDSATLSPLIKGMEAAGFVQRRRNPLDERSVHVCLTDKGREVATQAIIAAEGLACTIDLDPEDAGRIRDDVKRVHAALRLPRK